MCCVKIIVLCVKCFVLDIFLNAWCCVMFKVRTNIFYGMCYSAANRPILDVWNVHLIEHST